MVLVRESEFQRQEVSKEFSKSDILKEIRNAKNTRTTLSNTKKLQERI